ncbi:metalloendoproteinase 3-MMP-like [Chenopodium quinoa]|uniref:Peptidase metallopeptidase domain-containing protein n=1 Tax=Chenopodium quinoa TaxID=63459 RepID=A0A803MBT4_CHEQI|nr:metalloendoproteinase 3-MMP-like [Chenopodium quinoa]
MVAKAHHLFAILLLILTLNQHTIQSKQNASPFGFLKSLEGRRKGQNVDGLPKSEVTTTMTITENGESNVTRLVDATLMNPRNTTIPKKDENINRRSLYKVFGTKWPTTQTQLTYQVLSKTLVPGAQNMNSIVEAAFSKWAQHCPFTFQQIVEGDKSDFRFSFFKGDHGDGRPFDGPDGKLAHSFHPTDGRSHFDADENWSDDPGKDQFDLPSVVLHEMGHLLGLSHSDDVNAVMYATIRVGQRKRELQDDDIKGIQAIYNSSSS